MKRFAAIVTIVAAVGALIVTAAAATSGLRGGTCHVYLAGALTGGSGQPIVITGAFADAGRFTEAAPNSKVKLSRGTFKVDDSKGATEENSLFARLPSLIDPN